MSSKEYEVYYSPLYYFEESNIKKEKLEDHKDYLYIRCPVWNHLFDRTFVLNSPIDFEIHLDPDQKNLMHYKVGDEEFNTIDFFKEKFERDTFENDLFTVYVPDILRDHPVIQFSCLSFYFWTPLDLDYVWFEFAEHPLTSFKNNFTALPGWFNLANHFRNTSLGIKVVDRSKPIIVKKGDPLHRVRFYTEDLNDLPLLIKKDPSEFPDEEMGKRIFMIRKNPELLKSILFEKGIKEKLLND